MSGLIVVAGFCQTGDQGGLVEAVGFGEVLEGLAVVTEFRIHESDEEVRVHELESGELHRDDILLVADSIAARAGEYADPLTLGEGLAGVFFLDDGDAAALVEFDLDFDTLL